LNLLSGFADISLIQLVLVACVALFASVIGGIAGYGTGALMPLVLVPLIGAEPVVPIIAISAIFSNFSRATAYRHSIDRRRAGIVILASAVTTALGAYGYTMLTSASAALVIGTMLILSVPLRRFARHRQLRIGEAGLGVGAVAYGVVVGGTSGSGVILLSLLMASGLEGAAVIATDAVISLSTGIIKISVFGLARVVTAQVIAFALLIGAIALPGAFRQALCRANARARPHRDPRRCRDRRRHRHDLGRAKTPALIEHALRPFHFGRHRGQDGVDIAAGLQAEDGAAVIQQIEFDIAAAPDQLLVAIGLRPWCREIPPDQFRVDFQEGAADALREGKIGVPVAGIMMVVEDAADAAGLLAMGEVEVIVAPFPVFVVRRDSPMRIAGGFHGGMEGDCVGIVLGAPPVQDRG
jgi:uncharacterized membrane protein YfcA